MSRTKIIVGKDSMGAAVVVNTFHAATVIGLLHGDVTIEGYDSLTARDRVADCNCDQIVCVCNEIRAHKIKCRFRVALTCPVAIECDHGVDVCPQCDSCTCSVKPTTGKEP